MAAFWVSLAATLIALFAAFVSYIVFRSQADPEVVVYVQADEKRASLINLVIENIGRTTTSSTSLKTSRRLRRRWRSLPSRESLASTRP